MRKRQKEILPALCPEQEAAAERILKTDKRATILTGCAGAGKSVLMKTLVDRHPFRFTVTSTTARSALHIGGVTVDRLFSMNRDTWKFRNWDKMDTNLRRIGDFVIIDEASMVGSRMAELIMTAIDHCKKKVILCGDWAQASPVKDEWPLGHELFKKADIIFLKECHRQHDSEFLRALNEVRVGRISQEGARFFMSRVTPQDTHERDVVKMYATNLRVDKYNDFRLRKHARERRRVIYEEAANLRDVRPDFAREAYPLKESERERILNMSPLAHNEKFAPGCRVIITYNVPDPDFRNQPGQELWLAVNGDTGTLQDVEGEPNVHTMHIQLDRTGKTVHLNKMTLEVYGYSTTREDYLIKGFPVRLGYAITIHKSQGMTLDKVEVDMQSILNHPQETRHGLAYVAFSRARTPEGLSLLNWIESAIYSDPCMNKLVHAAEAEIPVSP